MTDEMQFSIQRWANRTFGKSVSNIATACRAQIEMSELLTALARNDMSDKAGEEIADIVIVLARLAQDLGVSIEQEVDRKMEINRNREWVLSGDGHGYHI